MGEPGDVEPGDYVRTAWGMKGFLISITGDSGLVCTGSSRREIVELKFLRKAQPDHAVAWLDMKEGDDA